MPTPEDLVREVTRLIETAPSARPEVERVTIEDIRRSLRALIGFKELKLVR